MTHRLAAALTLAISVCLTSVAGEPAGFTPTSKPVSPDGVRATADLPASQHMRNTGGLGRGGPGTGLGLCVFTSITHSARWQNIVNLEGFRKWMESKPGGGDPAKVNVMLTAWCKEKGVPVPAYVQHTGGDDAFIELALRTGRCPCVTYAGMDDFYSAGIDHMVNLVYLDATHACILDNNRPGVFLWMTRSEFLSRWRARGGGGWAIVFLDAPPPPYNSTPIAAASCGCDGEPCDCGPGCKCPRPAAVIGQQQCPNGRCLPSRSGQSPFPIGSPPSDRHEWGQFPDGDYGWRFKAERAAAGDGLPTGVVPERIHDHPAYSLNGLAVTKDEAHAALGSTDLSDDSDRWHLAAVGDTAFLARFRSDVDQLPVATRAKLLVQAYTPTAWQVSQFKLPAGVVLRKPTTGRLSADIGAIAAAEYSSNRLTLLLGEPTGPTPRPTPPPVDPKPAPPVTPAPTPDTPAPEPEKPSTIWQWLAAAAAFLLFRRK